MLRRAKTINKLVAFVLCLLMMLSPINFGMNNEMIPGNIASADEPEPSASVGIRGGTILHAFCWSFNTIKDNMADIAEAGFTAVQTSPIQACLDTSPAMILVGDNGRWYYHYQPTDFTIGNYQLGTREEFQEMCREAALYGIKIIVDVVPNHTTTNRSKVSQDLIDYVGGQDKLYHHPNGLTNSSNYSDRLETTTYAIGNLPDIDTENPDFQDYFIRFLNDAIADGASGFRYDSAKHIGLPGDPIPTAAPYQENNFWERVTTEITNAENIFNYGEVLQGSGDRIADYANAIGATTASAYGASIRTALVKNSYLASTITDYKAEGVDPDNLVTWVESHDNYYNDNTGTQFDNTQVILGWAIITARAEGTPLFFNRPQGSSLENPWGTNTIGIAGDDTFKDPQVVAVNKFRTAMAGEPENLINPNGNAQVLMIERGERGLVVINGSSSSYVLDADTNLADGTYINHADPDGVFTVVDGEISGVLPAKSVVVLYGPEATNFTTVHFYNGENWNSVYAYSETFFGAYPGTLASNDGDGWWRITVPTDADLPGGFNLTFSDGGEENYVALHVNDSSKLYFTSRDTTAYASKAEAEEALGITKTAIHFFNSSSWRDVKAYVYIDGSGDQLLGGWPGSTAISNGDGWWTANIPAEPSDILHIIFNNGAGGEGNQSADFVINDTTNVYVTNENDTKYPSKMEALTAIDMVPGITVAYFYNAKNWDQVAAYTWGAVNLGAWPGTLATEVGGGWWKIELAAEPSMDLNLIFNNNNNGDQTASLLVSNITNRYFCPRSDRAYPSKAAVEALYESTVTTTVYYYNSRGWDTVKAYVYGSYSTGGWPGVNCTDLGDDWWSFDIPDAPGSNLHIIFNNGSGGGTNQSDDFIISDDTHIYLTGYGNTKYTSMEEATAEKILVSVVTPSAVTAINGVDKTAAALGLPATVRLTTDRGNVDAVVTWNLEEVDYDPLSGEEQTFTVNGTITLPSGVTNPNSVSLEASISVTVEADVTTTVYFLNTRGWSSVSVYVYGPGELLGGWPGTAATEDGNNWWRIEIPCAPLSNLNVIFNGGGAQTEFLINNGTNIYVTGASGTKYASKEAAEAAVFDKNLIRVVTPSAITAVINGSPKTAEGLGLPATVTLETDRGDITANVVWDVDSCEYDPSSREAQSFIVSGNVTLPTGVTNTNEVSLTVTVGVSVEAYTGTVNRTLVRVVAPNPVIGVPNGTLKTAIALGLPTTVNLVLDDDSEIAAAVLWDVNASDYIPEIAREQTFTVNGTITLPADIDNPNHVDLSIAIMVNVNSATSTGGNTGGNTGGSTGGGTDESTGENTGSNSEDIKLENMDLENGSYVIPSDSIIKSLNESKDSTVNVSVTLPNSNTASGLVLKADILNEAKNAGKTLSVTVKDEDGKDLYSWSFDKDELSSKANEMTDVDLSLKINALSDDDSTNQISDGKGLLIDFAHHGELPAQAKVKVYVGNIDGLKAGDKIYLYHINESTGMLEELPNSTSYVVDQDGYITIDIMHCSDYAVLTQKAPKEMLVDLKEQIKVSVPYKTFYVGGTKQSTANITIELPITLERVMSLDDKTSISAKAGVTVSYSSTNEKVATVDEKGVITAVAPGVAVINTTFKLSTGQKKNIRTIINVKKASAKLTGSTKSMKLGSKFTFKAEVLGYDMSDIIWTTSKKSIVVINKKTGVATAKSKGTDYVVMTIAGTKVKTKVVVK